MPNDGSGMPIGAVQETGGGGGVRVTGGGAAAAVVVNVLSGEVARFPAASLDFTL
jgi:hypothetical protein